MQPGVWTKDTSNVPQQPNNLSNSRSMSIHVSQDPVGSSEGPQWCSWTRSGRWKKHTINSGYRNRTYSSYSVPYVHHKNMAKSNHRWGPLWGSVFWDNLNLICMFLLHRTVLVDEIPPGCFGCCRICNMPWISHDLHTPIRWCQRLTPFRQKETDISYISSMRTKENNKQKGRIKYVLMWHW